MRSALEQLTLLMAAAPPNTAEMVSDRNALLATVRVGSSAPPSCKPMTTNWPLGLGVKAVMA